MRHAHNIFLYNFHLATKGNLTDGVHQTYNVVIASSIPFYYPNIRLYLAYHGVMRCLSKWWVNKMLINTLVKACTVSLNFFKNRLENISGQEKIDQLSLDFLKPLQIAIEPALIYKNDLANSWIHIAINNLLRFLMSKLCLDVLWRIQHIQMNFAVQ